ncbi:MAG: 2Fe-2S iron-sulfur cluster binding domain-containing protein [Erysipelotrichaceae bacterium]|nr:2Fe-2S iron-sulfur cluster binding domain-containing protein [Erysipelotrichaceae bacterium]
MKKQYDVIVVGASNGGLSAAANTAKANDSILRSLEKNGIKSLAHCRSGECGWCHSHLISCEVYTSKSVDGRREADLIYGYIHPCCTFPLSDLVIEVSPVK